MYFAKGVIPPEPSAAPVSGPNTTTLTHKFPLMSQQPMEFPGGREWLVDSSRFPISRTMTGLVFELDAEPSGPCTGTPMHLVAVRHRRPISRDSVRSQGRYREEVLNPGDVGYIPQGYGHSIENIGPETGRILLGLNSGTFQKIDLAEWIAGQPADVLMTNLDLPADQVAKLPRGDIFITDGLPPSS